MMTGLQDINWVELFGQIYMKLLLNERWNHLDILILKNLTRSKQVKYTLAGDHFIKITVTVILVSDIKSKHFRLC